MVRYWAAVIFEALKITWGVLFGSVLKVIVDSTLFLLATALLYYAGRKPQMLEQISWLEAFMAAAIIIFMPVFIANFFRVPYLREKRAVRNILELEKRAGVSESNSFELGFEIFPNPLENEETSPLNTRYGLMGFDRQVLCRIWVHNIRSQPIHNCRLVIE